VTAESAQRRREAGRAAPARGATSRVPGATAGPRLRGVHGPRRSPAWTMPVAITQRLVLAAWLGCWASSAAHAATPAQERQFVEAYRSAYEAADHRGLVALLYTEGADPQAVAFYKMMLGAEMGGRIASIELVQLTAEDRASAQTALSPTGRPMQLVLPATRKLVIRTGTTDRDGSTSATSEVFVGERDGRLWILLPSAAR